MKTTALSDPHQTGEGKRDLLASMSNNGLMVVSTKPKKIFSLLQDAFEFLFEDVKPLLDVFNVLATRENDLS